MFYSSVLDHKKSNEGGRRKIIKKKTIKPIFGNGDQMKNIGFFLENLKKVRAFDLPVYKKVNEGEIWKKRAKFFWGNLQQSNARTGQ